MPRPTLIPLATLVAIGALIDALLECSAATQDQKRAFSEASRVILAAGVKHD